MKSLSGCIIGFNQIDEIISAVFLALITRCHGNWNLVHNWSKILLNHSTKYAGESLLNKSLQKNIMNWLVEKLMNNQELEYNLI